jgi:acyl-CoA synthetase (AMP-forming)/AMP-acid ligase II
VATGSLYDSTTIWALVQARAALSPDHPMLVDASGAGLTFGEFATRAERVAAGFAAIGVGPGTPVTWQVPTTIETIVLAAALSRLGALQNPILHIYREREVAVALRGTRPEVLVIKPSWRGTDYSVLVATALASARAQLGRESLDPVICDLDDLPTGDPGTLLPPPAGDEDPVRWIYYTSGTTSEPKGVVHTDGTLLAGGRGLALALQVRQDDVGSVAFPFAHIAGPDYLVTMLLSGFAAVVLESFVPAEAVEVFSRNGVTMAGGSTAFYQAYLAEQRKTPAAPIIPTLRILSGGGAAKPPELFRAVRDEMGVRIIHGYGMTEIPMITMGSPSDSDEQLIATEGAPVYGAELRIAGPDGEPLGAGEDGEVRVRGPMVCKGYTDPVLTAEAFDDDGYFRTGDLGHLRPDGHLVLTGRLKDVIIRKGENISAREVEELVYRHPGVRDVAVIGLPDPERGERVCAVVELADGNGRLSLDELARFLEGEGLMRQKIPEQLEILDELPRNDTLRKVLKYQLRDRFGGAGR